MGSITDNNFGIQIVLYFELFDLLLTCVLVAFVIRVCVIVFDKWSLGSFAINEAKIGIGESLVVFKYDNRVRELAYKIWVELVTRKIGIVFDEENDVIVEVYDSWYEAFRIIRSFLEEIPVNRRKDTEGLVHVTVKVLNIGLREHLTKWQARFRRWYDLEKDKYPDLSPQEIQEKYPRYRELVDDIRVKNKVIIEYIEEIEKIVKER